MHDKKRRRSGLRRGFWACIIGEIAKSRCVSYFSTVPYISDLSAHTALQLLFYSGMRFGELLALTLADLDFKENTIHITKSLQHKAGGDIVTPPKTDNGIRTIPRQKQLCGNWQTMPIRYMA